MKKKSLIILMMIMMLVVATLLTMASCGEEEAPPTPVTPPPSGHTHTYGEWTLSKMPTATAQGEVQRTCSECKFTEKKSIPVNAGENYTVEVLTAPTCTAEGVARFTLTSLGFSFEAPLPMVDHSYGEWTEKVAPTCTHKGIYSRTCTVCGKEMTKDVDQLEHEYVDKNDENEHYKECIHCKDRIDVAPHDFTKWEIVKEESDTEDGLKSRKCKICGRVEEVVMHDTEDTIVAPTCENEGYVLHKCKRCQEEYKTDIVPALGHDWSAVTYEFAPDGHSCIARRECQRCFKEEVANANILGIMTLEPTCVKLGEHTYAAAFEEEWAEPQVLVVADIPYAEHIYVQQYSDTHHWMECDVCHTQLDKIPHNFKVCYDDHAHWQECTECGYVSAREKHNVVDWTVDSTPTCTTAGHRHGTCTVCGCAVNEDIEPLGHELIDRADDTHHWKECTRFAECGYKIDVEEHTFVDGYDEINHYRECSVCHHRVNVVAHTFTPWSEVTKPSLQTTGKLTRHCTGCDREESITLPILNKTDYTYARTEPTCHTLGVDKYTYTTAEGDEFVYTIDVPMIDHTWDAVKYTLSADKLSCTAERKCTVSGCGKVESVTTTNITKSVKIEPDCATMGTTTYTAIFTEEWAGTTNIDVQDIPMGEHNYKQKFDSVNHWLECKGCGAKKDIVPHTMGTWTKVTEPTLDAVGSIKRTCTGCAHEETFEMPVLSESNGYVKAVKQAPTCIATGIDTYTYTKDGDKLVYEVTTDMLPHTYGGDVTYEWNVDHTECTATRGCTRTPGCTAKENAVSTNIATEETVGDCQHKGTIKYTATFAEAWAGSTSDTVETTFGEHDYVMISTDPTYHYEQCTICGTIKGTKEEHVYGPWTNTLDPTCTATGTKEHVCKCGHKETATVDALGHNMIYASDENNHWQQCERYGQNGCTGKTVAEPHDELAYGYNDTHHWTKCSVCGKENKNIQTLHSFNEDGECVCGYKKFAFTLEADGQSYCLTKCNITGESNIVIPATYKGIPVVSIGTKAFENCLQNNIVLTIPASINHMYADAFSGTMQIMQVKITDLTAWCNINFENYYSNPLSRNAAISVNSMSNTFDITIPEGVTSLRYTFTGCGSLRSVVLPTSLATVGEGTFAGCTLLDTVTFNGNVTTIGAGAFTGCTNLATITLPDSVTTIERDAFANCTKLGTVNMGNVATIGDLAFNKCAKNIVINTKAIERQVGWYSTLETDVKTINYGQK